MAVQKNGGRLISSVLVGLVALLGSAGRGFPFSSKSDLREQTAPSQIVSATATANATAVVNSKNSEALPPFTPTGELQTRLPASNQKKPGKESTSVLPPGVSFVTPTREFYAVVPTFAPIVGLPPSNEWTTYTNKEFGFSFEHPSNWFIEATEKSPQSVSKGYGLIVRNYRDYPTKEDKTIEQLKIDIEVMPLPDSTNNLSEWVRHRFDPKVIDNDASFSATPVEHFKIDGIPAVRWIEKAQMIPQGAVIIGMIKDQRLYFFWAYPATSKYVSTLDQIVSSLRLP